MMKTVMARGTRMVMIAEAWQPFGRQNQRELGGRRREENWSLGRGCLVEERTCTAGRAKLPLPMRMGGNGLARATAGVWCGDERLHRQRVAGAWLLALRVLIAAGDSRERER